MRLSDIERKARDLKIKDTWKYQKKDLIKTIQRAEGNADCFGNNKASTCGQSLCCWREECLR